jgi:uncharacterized protein YjeT (DUF2065 family)
MVLQTVLYTIGIIALVEGLAITFFPNNCKRIVLQSLKNKKKVRKLGIIETVIALVLILIAKFI